MFKCACNLRESECNYPDCSKGDENKGIKRRQTNDTLFMTIAFALAKRSTCRRRAVGAVAVDKDGYILGTGYNGAPKGMPHCIDRPCEGASAPSGTGLDLCEAIHAEQNLLLRIKDVREIHTIYCTTEPCTHCSKMIANTGCVKVIYADKYPDARHPGNVMYHQYMGDF